MPDRELAAVKNSFRQIPNLESRIARVLRDTYDQIYYGQKTGRFRVSQLFKTEKTHFGSLVEINLRREFEQEIQDGNKMDYQIAGVEVDCKFSQKLGGWMIPLEARGEVCLLVWSEDTATPNWSLGLVRASESHLNSGGNQDKKVTLNKAGMQAVEWLFKNAEMPPNVLLQLPDVDVARIFQNRSSGQQRINELFRVAQKRRIGRAIIATVAQQEDYMKRVRGNGGARSLLKPEGIIILGDYRSHKTLARKLGLPDPQEGEFVSARVYPAERNKPTDCLKASIASSILWRLAGPSDPVVEAPNLPSI
jgi:hypothetical protein